jgi:SAM-dependent methyltransferase
MTEIVKTTRDTARERIREIAADYAERGDDLGWFEAVYREADGNPEKLPWGHLEPNRFFKEWAERHDLTGDGRKALVVGCGLGDDAGYLDGLGFEVTAFDISSTAVNWAKRLNSETDIKFETADLFHPPQNWHDSFDLVLEIYTIQPLPMGLRSKAIDSVASFVAPGGRLVVVCRGRDDDQELEQLPWPLSRRELARFTESGLTEVGFRAIWDAEEKQMRFLAEYQRA